MRDKERNDATVAQLERALKPVVPPVDREPFVHKIVKWNKPFNGADIQLDANVPIPDITHGDRGSKYNKLFARMQEGNSCLLPIDLRKQVQSAAQIWRKQGHEAWHFVTRIEGDDQFRLWRSKDSNPNEAVKANSSTGGSDSK